MKSLRWSLFIDFEGFSHHLVADTDNILRALSDFVRLVHVIGKTSYRIPPDRFFAHQLGDAFYIISEHEEKNYENPLSIAIIILRYFAINNFYMKASISEGTNGDITGLYDNDTIDEIKKGSSQIKTLQTVMGTGLVNAVKEQSNSIQGPLLFINKKNAWKIPPWVKFTHLNSSKQCAIDWIHSDSRTIDRILSAAQLTKPKQSRLEKQLKSYCGKADTPKEWGQNALHYLHIP